MLRPLVDQPLGYRINIFLARICFAEFIFPMLGKLAWVKVVAGNRHTIFVGQGGSLGRGLSKPHNRAGQTRTKGCGITTAS
jgi:hypothetical protein